MVEHTTDNRDVTGSIPVSSTKECAGSSVVEQGTLNPKAVGSTPTRHTRMHLYLIRE